MKKNQLSGIWLIQSIINKARVQIIKRGYQWTLNLRKTHMLDKLIIHK